jgi:hypothetical protein
MNCQHGSLAVGSDACANRVEYHTDRGSRERGGVGADADRPARSAVERAEADVGRFGSSGEGGHQRPANAVSDQGEDDLLVLGLKTRARRRARRGQPGDRTVRAGLVPVEER